MFRNGSLHLGTYAGIPLKVHWTFSFILVLVLAVGFGRGRALSEIGLILILVGISFTCVVLHEYGHALMAKRFNVRTIDIILSPIGGLARLERLPSKPMQEFYIAIAGPLVNVFIAFILSVILLIGSKPILIDLNSSVSNFDNWGAYLSIVLYINLFLFLFNLIPAFPMDGGRILRSLLSISLGKKRSTDIASWIGYTIAFGFMVIGIIYTYYTLSIIGVFVLIMARGEKISARQEEFLIQNDASLEDLMTHHKFYRDSAMHEVIQNYKEINARNFMVYEGEHISGVVTEPALKACIKEEDFEAPVSKYTEHNFKIVDNTNLQSLLSQMNQLRTRFLLVRQSETDFGMLERYKIIEHMNKSR